MIFKLIRSQCHRIFYEHRGVFHRLGCGHGGKVAPGVRTPLRLTGFGRTKRDCEVEDLFDRHYGPLFDRVCAFKGHAAWVEADPLRFICRLTRVARPRLFRGASRVMRWKFINVVGEMGSTFARKGWTGTRFELFFNHSEAIQRLWTCECGS